MRPVLRLAGPLIALATCLAGLAPSAFAGSYVVSTCSPFTTPGLDRDEYGAQLASPPASSAAGPPIGPLGGGDQGALYAEDTLNASRQIPDGAGPAGRSPPRPATITAITYYRSLASYGSRRSRSGLFQADGSPLEQCMIPFPFPPGRASFAPSPTPRRR